MEYECFYYVFVDYFFYGCVEYWKVVGVCNLCYVNCILIFFEGVGDFDVVNGVLWINNFVNDCGRDVGIV